LKRNASERDPTNRRYDCLPIPVLTLRWTVRGTWHPYLAFRTIFRAAGHTKEIIVNTANPQAAAAAPSRPVSGGKITESYARMVARNAYFWAWPLINIYSRRIAYSQVPEPGLMGGIVPVAPINRLSMLTDDVAPQERLVACPNQDVIYGTGSLALDLSPIVIQVPDFGDRFWVYQVVDLPTDSFADLGTMYGTKPGFYLLVGPDWRGETPEGITRVFRATTHTGFVIPRVFQDDTPEDNTVVQALINQIDMYPLSLFDGSMKRRDWSQVPHFPSQGSGEEEMKWVVPEKFVDELPVVLADTPPLPGEETRYTEIQTILAAAQDDPALRAAITDEAVRAEDEVVVPLFQFRNYGIPLPDHWTTQDNGAVFATDYLTRTAVGKSNIFVNTPNETKYFYQDLDANGIRLNGNNRYTVTFAAGGLPPVRGFWSLTLYNEHHFFASNGIHRYSVGTKNKQMRFGADGSLTIAVHADTPGADKAANWLPTPSGADFSLYIRAYWPQEPITAGRWLPPGVVRAQ
jgi:hypothetical protein